MQRGNKKSESKENNTQKRAACKLREMRSGSICIRLLLQDMWSEVGLGLGEADAHEAGNQSTKRYAYVDCQNQEGEINGHCR